MELSTETLPKLNGGIRVPAYDRRDVRAGILHVGMGNFHRAHQAVYLEDLLEQGGGRDWGILGAGVMPADGRMREGLAAQDFLYTVVEQSAAGTNARVIGAMTGFLAVEDGHGPILEAMADPDIRIVSLTVTEGGYFIDAATGRFDRTHPAIRRDIDQPESPGTVFGAIVAGLRARRAAGQKPFTVMSCDNVPHNGVVTRNAVLGVAREQDPDLADWIEANVAFPNGMVDRITPATTDRRRKVLADGFGLDDRVPVFCEPFRQWVLEDRFPAGRPALEEVGVQFVPDVTPYENMKIRILNGGHAIIAYSGGLLDLEFAHDAMAHPLVSGLLEKVERDEVIPVVPPVPDTSLDAYFTLVRERFSNPSVEDTIRRLCLDGSNRQPKFIVPSIVDRLAAGKSVDGLALVSALWCRYCFGTTDSGAVTEPNDPNWDHLVTMSKAARQDPSAWLGMEDVYGAAGRDPRLQAAFAAALKSVWQDGTAATLKRYLA